MSAIQIAVDLEGDFTIQEIKTKPGIFVQKGQILFSLKENSSGKVTKIKAPTAGKSTKVHKKNGQNVKKG